LDSPLDARDPQHQRPAVMTGTNQAINTIAAVNDDANTAVEYGLEDHAPHVTHSIWKTQPPREPWVDQNDKSPDPLMT